MKKVLCAVLALLLVLTGCRTVGEETVPPTEPSLEATEADRTYETTIPVLPEGGFDPGPINGGQTGEELPFTNPGKLRISYTGDRCYVRYVTAVEQLPPEGDWGFYDETFFETGALVILVETVSSGSVQLELESIRVDGDTANVTVKRTMSGDVGTADMATWLLWAEVEKNLNYTWILEGASQNPQPEKY